MSNNKQLDLCYSRCILANDYEQSLEQYERRVLLGSFAQALDRSIHNGRWSHKFSVYMKAIKEGDVANAAANLPDSYEPLADYAVKVVFRFSDNCSNCIHLVESPPFESGAFCNDDTKVTVTILFRDSSHTCTIFHHYVSMALDPNNPSIQETVRTIFFVNPSNMMKRMLKIPVDSEPEMDDAPELPLSDDVQVQEPDDEQQEASEKEQVEDTSSDEQWQEDNDSESEGDSQDCSQDAEEDSSDSHDSQGSQGSQNELQNEPQNDSMEDPQEMPGDEPQNSVPDSELGHPTNNVWKEILDYNSEDGDELEEGSGDSLEMNEEASIDILETIEEDQEAEAQAMYEQEQEDAAENAAALEEEKVELSEDELEIQRQQDELNEDLKRARESLDQERRFIVNPGPREV